ncbi:MAG: hypothetical protein HY482_00255 [Candidatus Wildermuthbacteria bacterium]|nr:hypothetical protein [Candidatus Wildermuthbacteria bacterium]
MKAGLENIAPVLYEIGAIKFGEPLEFTLSSGLLSSVYLDLRVARFYPQVRNLLLYHYINMADALRPRWNFIADVPTGATFVASIMADRLGVPMITPLQSPKTHGIQAEIIGPEVPGTRVLLVDDILTTGGTLARAATTLRKARFEVGHALVFLDRQQGGMENLSRCGCEIHASFTLAEFLEYYLQKGILERARYKEIMDSLVLNR